MSKHLIAKTKYTYKSRQRRKPNRGKVKPQNVHALGYKSDDPVMTPFSSELKYIDTTIGATSAVSNVGTWTT